MKWMGGRRGREATAQRKAGGQGKRVEEERDGGAVTAVGSTQQRATKQQIFQSYALR